MSSGNVSIFWHCLVSETFIRSSMEFGECGSPAKPPYSVSRSNLLESMMPSLPIFQLLEEDEVDLGATTFTHLQTRGSEQ